MLRACVERLTAGELLELADLATARRRAGRSDRRVQPDARQRGGDATAVEADLSPGHPLRPETWVAIFEERGFDDVHAAAAGEAARTSSPRTAT